MSKRILGHQRIFQSVFNDLNMNHEIVTLKDGRQVYAYVYDGVDPYELEDNAFPKTVEAIKAHADMVIGEDEKHFNGKPMVNPSITCEECGSPDERYIRNELRAEQQARNRSNG